MALTVIDAGIVIAVLDPADAHHSAASRALLDARANGDVLVLPMSAYSEALVAPARRGGEAVAVVDSLIDTIPASVQPVTREIARSAAHMRAQYGTRLRLPDALVLATALELSADLLLTTDRGWPAAGIRIAVV